ncbi:hypothetical protein, partial [Cysteiniphilum litorale]|uniref:hypothetical protein n=1 Tax=Cysteiniphilum litorale TaxID=2056700 RepID=UPI003F8847F3
TFTADDNKSALTHQQRQIDEVISQLNKLKTDNQSLSDTLRTQRENFEKENAALKKALEVQNQQMQQNQETQQWVEGVKRPLRGLSGSHKVGANGENETKPKDANRSQLPHGQSLSDLNYPDYHDNFNHGDIFSRGESVSHEQTEATPVVRLPVSFSKTVVEKEPISKYIRTHKNYVPTGTFCEAILLGAAEAQAGVDAQGDASPIMFEVKNNCFLPNGKRSYLKGAFITASVYGRISSSRGMVRLEHLSLVRKDGSILD